MKVADHLRLIIVSAALGAAAFGVPAAGAAILAPQTIDAGTGMDAHDVGASFGARTAWAAFTQTTDGKSRLYVAWARNGKFDAPQAADRGNAVMQASLGGNRRGQAVAVFTEQVGGVAVLFSRRLAGGGGGPVLQVSADTQSASLPNAAAGLQHVRAVAMNASGTSAACYRDALSASSFVAVLAPGAPAWQRFGPLKADVCVDIGVDARGNVIVVGQDIGADLYADLVVGGVLKSELIDADGMDEPSLALSPKGIAVALARVDVGGNFGVAAWRKADIASDAPWSKLGRIDENATDFATEASEFPRGAIGANGNGILTFRAFNPTAVTGRIFLVRLTGSTVGPAIFVAPENDDAVPEIDARGRAFLAYTATAGGVLVPVVRVVGPTTIGAARRLVPDGTPGTELRNVVSFVADGAGDLLALLRSGEAPVRAVAVFGDLRGPTLRPRSLPARPRAGRRAELRSRAADSFSTLAGKNVRWKFPRDAVRGSRNRTGLTIHVRFAHAGRVRVRITVVDRARHRTTKSLVIRVRQPR